MTLPIFQLFFQCSQLEKPRHQPKLSSNEFRRSSEAYRSTAWRSVHCMGRCIRTNARKPMRPSKEQAPRSRGVGSIEGSDSTSPSWGCWGWHFLMPEGVEKPPVFCGLDVRGTREHMIKYQSCNRHRALVGGVDQCMVTSCNGWICQVQESRM